MNAIDETLASVVRRDVMPTDAEAAMALSPRCDAVRRVFAQRAVRAAAARLLHVQRLRDGLDPDGELGEVIGSVATALSRSARAARALWIVPGGDHGPDAAQHSLPTKGTTDGKNR